jgi:Mg2+-importing ATPase
VAGTMVGSEVERLTMEELKKKVETVTIFARLNPEQKQKIILALKQNQHVVGFLGDGINDAVSLRTADVGISVNNAVDVAKESADLILLKKDLRVLIVGIEAGRRTFANILKYIMMGTSSTFGNMLSLAVASLFLPFLPLLPVQVLLNDLMYDGSQIMLAKDNVDTALTYRPRKWSLKFINKYMVVFGTVSSIFDLITFYILYVVFKDSPVAFQTGWFTESIVTQMLVVFSIRTVVVPFYKSKANPVFAVAILGIVGLALLLPYLQPIAGYFHLVAQPVVFYEMLLVICICYIGLIELTKKYFYSKNRS